jgi:hypothetical protein
VLPLTERLERAFSRALNDLPKQTQLLLLIAALNDRGSTGEILQAAALAAGRRIDLDALEPAALAGLIELDVSFVRAAQAPNASYGCLTREHLRSPVTPQFSAS